MCVKIYLIQRNFLHIYLFCWLFYICITYFKIPSKNVHSFNLFLCCQEEEANKIIKLFKNQWSTPKKYIYSQWCARLLRSEKIAHTHTHRGREREERTWKTIDKSISIYPVTPAWNHIFFCCCRYFFAACFALRIIILTHCQSHSYKMAMEKCE